MQDLDEPAERFEWQLSDLFVVVAALAFMSAYAIHPTQEWAKLASALVLGAWVYVSMRRGRRIPLSRALALCVVIGLHFMVLMLIKRLLERGFS